MSTPAANEKPVATVTTNQFSLNWRDVLRGLIMAVVSAVFAAIYESLAGDAGFSGIDWQAVLKVAALTAMAYLSKNFFDATRTTTIFKKV